MSSSLTRYLAAGGSHCPLNLLKFEKLQNAGFVTSPDARGVNSNAYHAIALRQLRGLLTHCFFRGILMRVRSEYVLKGILE